MKYVYNDGGRTAAGFKGDTGDCSTRAIAIATGRPYREVYDTLNASAKSIRPSKRHPKGHGSARTGVSTKVLHDYFKAIGWRWVACMGIGTGTKVHLKADELPSGKIVCRVTGHVVAVIDGIAHDTYNCSRGGTRAVYGYWTK
jgi:hypothetical protein